MYIHTRATDYFIMQIGTWRRLRRIEQHVEYARVTWRLARSAWDRRDRLLALEHETRARKHIQHARDIKRNLALYADADA